MGPGFFETLDRNKDGLVPPAELQADLARGLTLGRDAGIIVSDLLPGGLAERAGLRLVDVLDTATMMSAVTHRPRRSASAPPPMIEFWQPAEPYYLRGATTSTALAA